MTNAVVPLVGFVASVGVAPDELLRAARLEPTLFAGPDIHLLRSQEMRLWDEAARLTADEDFGLHFAQWLAPRTEEAFDLLSFALRSCATLGEHYRRAAHYLRLVHDGIALSLHEEGDVARLVHRHVDESGPPPRHPVEAFLALALLLGSRATGAPLVPRGVRFEHRRPARVSEHERVFRARVQFGCPRSELELDRAALARPQLHAEPRLLAVLNRQLDGLLAEQPEPLGFIDAVRRSVMDELPDREPSITGIAAKRRMSPRTLQRRLQLEGTSFAEVLADVRRELALRYLSDPRIAIAEVAYLLGFQDVTAFHRAFKRWTGVTPASHRRAASSGVGDPTVVPR